MTAAIIFLVVPLSENVSARAQPHGAREVAKTAVIDANGNRAMFSKADSRSSLPVVLAGGAIPASNARSLVLDGWWSRRFALSHCEAEMTGTPEAELVFQKDRCATLDPAAAAFDFENRLMKVLQTTASCGHIAVARYNGPAEASLELYRLMAMPHWSLALDFKPGALLQTWTLSNGSGTYSRGESEAVERMAGDICSAIARAEQGTTIVEDRARLKETASVRF